MMNIHVFQKPLFDETPRMDRDHLEGVLKNTTLIEAVKRGMKKAELEFPKIVEPIYITSRDKSSNYHACICYAVLEELRELNLEEVRANFCPAGNERQFFTAWGYTFIFKNIGTKWNGTDQADRIQNQDCATPVVILLYNFDSLTGVITSVTFSYSSLDFNLSHSFDLSSVIQQNEEQEENDKPMRPTLKENISQKGKRTV